MDVRFINPFIEAITHLFKTMLKTDLMIGKPVVKDDDELRADVSAVIGFSGDAVGCMVLRFPVTTAVKVASTFAGVEMSKDHEDFPDALGELANIVAGGAKGKFEGMQIGISLPSVIIGKEHAVLQSKQRPRLVIPCDSTLGRFAVEVAMVIEKKQGTGTPEPATAGAGAT